MTECNNSEFPTVLVIDDQEKVLDAIKRRTHDCSLNIITTKDPSAAFLCIRRRNPDVVICDERMPAVRGHRILSYTKKRFPNVVRIMMTGHPSLESAVHGINLAGIFRILLKPFSKEELLTAIYDGLEYRKQLLNVQLLISKSERKNDALSDLERKYPGITKVKRTKSGALELLDNDEDSNLIDAEDAFAQEHENLQR